MAAAGQGRGARCVALVGHAPGLGSPAAGQAVLLAGTGGTSSL